VAAGQYVMLAVSDTGSGIAPAHLPRVFEPFFTTKDKGRGTGLGLAMVYGFAKQSGGHVSIYSELGHGTTVKLYLPRAPAAGPLADLPPAGEATVRGGTETVLVVEDDEPVRQLACLELRALGYRVLDAACGADALRIIEGGEAIDLLFTDVVMPGGLSGRQLADAAQALRPGCPWCTPRATPRTPSCTTAGSMPA
jgi:CheY-like chemotaxis protein